MSTLSLGRIQALTSFVISEIIEADFATNCDLASLAEMIIYPSYVGTRGARRRYDLLAATLNNH
ncbi:hypothetical protein [Nostoc sp.]|uniref:hypothetical protein n=1 Tax=Nostoc sp. TaxID=1180 RepID=UPI002FF73AA8